MAEDKNQSTEAEIRAGIPSLDKFDVYGNKVLIGIYMRPKVTKGGIHLSDKFVDEDKWQGKVGVVLKKGTLAFVDDANNAFNGDNVEVGDWIIAKNSDGFSLDIEGVHCRMIQDVHIQGRVSDPSLIY